MRFTEIMTSTLIKMKTQNSTQNIISISITHIWRTWMNKLQIFFFFFFRRISDVDEKYCNRTDSVSRYDDLMKYLSWILISIQIDLSLHDLAIKIDKETKMTNISERSQVNQDWQRDQDDQYWQEKSSSLILARVVKMIKIDYMIMLRIHTIQSSIQKI